MACCIVASATGTKRQSCLYAWRIRRSATDKVIVTALLTIAGVVAAVLVINAVYPAVTSSGNALVSVAENMETRIKSDISIVQAIGELDSNGLWQDTNLDGDFDVFVWVKNVGTTRIDGINRSDVFYGQEGDFQAIPHQDYAEGSKPYWNYSLENGTRWSQSVTLKIEISFSSAETSGTYWVKVIEPSGGSDELYFSM